MHTSLKNEIQTFKSVNNALKTEIEQLKEDKKEIGTKFETLKLAKTIKMSSGDTQDAKIKINKIVREIDECIALMNK